MVVQGSIKYQEQELEKAVEDNTRLLESRLNKQTPNEIKIEKEVNKLQEKLDKMNLELEKHREEREKSLEPYRNRDDELKEKLKFVRLQLETVRGMRERSMSSSSLNVSAPAFDLISNTQDIKSGYFSSSPSSPTSPNQPPSYKEAFGINI
ncbi:uncharacterized protein LOC111697521 isoform X2 [Eurytemora carolleeae]|uniref:uncharacterized protein LOC111697521 isoform X2 n=1 Tax=Eurytemora carolleeae TaxID=1294199 RepID=UPI000C759036|nr:uncharacterized protein LOC111697521 isoform X2 [Eurytemora carolleeae]|eukprot:XP_023323316.1 uncharacterized protein LOC111697521 isoform X2 [Eurytemora affinis]